MFPFVCHITERGYIMDGWQREMTFSSRNRSSSFLARLGEENTTRHSIGMRYQWFRMEMCGVPENDFAAM